MRRRFERGVVNKDIVVVGAGTAGICAALAAARLGMKTALVTDRPVLGGSASSEIRVTISGAEASPWNRFARETGIIEEMTLRLADRAARSGKWRWMKLLAGHAQQLAVDAETPPPMTAVVLPKHTLQVARLKMLFVAAKIRFHGNRDEVRFSVHEQRAAGLMDFLNYLDYRRREAA